MLQISSEKCSVISICFEFAPNEQQKFIKLISKNMEIGVAIALFVIIAIILALLFTLTSVLFTYKLRKARQIQYQPYELIDSSEIDYDQLQDTEYEEFIKKRDQQKKAKQLLKDKKNKLMMELANLQEPYHETVIPFNENRNSRENSVLKSTNFMNETGRSLWSHKTFKPDKLFTNRSKKSFKDRKGSLQSADSIPGLQADRNSMQNSKKDKEKSYTLVSSLISYSQQGIDIIQANITHVWLEYSSDTLHRTTKITRRTIRSQQFQFKQILDAYGFEIDNYCAYKFILEFDPSEFQPNRRFRIGQLSCSEKKESIQQSDYLWEREQMET